ncbi:MAG: putative Ig domain-containing protein [Planctomycetaceae bacterium]
MDDQKRTKLLAAGLGAVVAVYFGRSVVTNWVMGPIRDLERKVATAEAQAEKLADQEIQLNVAQRNLKDWKAISLPGDLDSAQRLYREWVFDLARQCGFSGSGFEVIPGARSAQKEFSTVAVEIKKAEVDLQGLARFLYLFDQSALLHRISGMKVDSPGAQGNPRLAVTLTVEGMSVTGTENRAELLPRTRLAGAIDDKAVLLKAVPNELFPVQSEGFEPFLVRLDRELLQVTEVGEAGWKVVRGYAGTKSVSHADLSTVELFPVLWDRREKRLEDYQALVAASPFVLPAAAKSWSPRVAGVSDKTIRPGETVSLTAKLDNADPELGTAAFALEDAAEGMSIDATNGQFTWSPAESLQPGKYSAVVAAVQSGKPDQKISTKVTITIQEQNVAPKITLQSAATVVLGREFSLQAAATDDGPVESLKYSLGGGAPEGLGIDAKTGLLKWLPARSFTPGKYDVTVNVTDGGRDPKSASAKVALDVQDDFAAMTTLTGTVARDGIWFAWLRNRATGVTLKLKAGEVVRISEIAAEITEITARHVLLKDPAGIWKLVLGGTLRERVLEVPAEPTAAGAAAAETETVSGAADAVVAPKPAPAAEEPVVPEGTPAPATPVTPAPADPAAPATPVSPDPAAPAEPPAPAAPPAPAVPTTG